MVARPDPWGYKNASTTAGFPVYGDLGVEILIQLEALMKQYRRLMRRGGRTLGKVIDIYFFVSSLRNLREIADYSAARLGLSRIAKAIKTFDSAVPDAKNVRDIHDHIRDLRIANTSRFSRACGLEFRTQGSEDACLTTNRVEETERIPGLSERCLLAGRPCICALSRKLDSLDLLYVD